MHRRVVRFYDLPLEHAVLVAGVEEGSPAARAGLAEGDLIVSFDGKAVSSVDELHRLLTEERIGVTAAMEIIRLTEKLVVEVTPERAK
jgi:S1-C subfamily serine protease